MTQLPLLSTLLLLALAAPAGAMVRLPENPGPIEGNPAGRLLSLPIEGSALRRRAQVHAEGVAARERGKRKLNATIAHRDHVHIGMTRRGAVARTSFWSRGR